MGKDKELMDQIHMNEWLNSNNITITIASVKLNKCKQHTH